MKASLLVLLIYLGAVCGYLPIPRISSIGGAGDSAISRFSNTLGDAEQGVINHVQLGITNDYDSGTDLLAHIDVSSDQVRGLMFQGVINHVQLGITNDYDSGTDLLAHIDVSSDQVRGLMFQGVINHVQLGITNDYDSGMDFLVRINVIGDQVRESYVPGSYRPCTAEYL
ncbi:hypothetical protein J6590_052811 [Homalodisca vitripennis]|nr:hypothetical protein J6590_052811 [Homalodisca vitripennis]